MGNRLRCCLLKWKERISWGLSGPVEVVRDGLVVLRGLAEDLGRQGLAEMRTDFAVQLELVDHQHVVVRVHDHGHAVVVLGRGADHGGAADVNLLDGLVPGRVRLGHGLLKRVEVDHDHVHHLDFQLLEGRLVLRRALGQDAAEDLGVQGLEPSLQALRESGDLRHIQNWEARFPQMLGGAAGGDDLPVETGETLYEGQEPGLVVHTDDGTWHFDTPFRFWQVDYQAYRQGNTGDGKKQELKEACSYQHLHAVLLGPWAHSSSLAHPSSFGLRRTISFF